MKISVENLRGFEGAHSLSIQPITILIGENSSGKTTLLAAIYAILNREFPTGDNLFNRTPFELGSYDTIATYRGGKYGRAGHFSLGWENEVADSGKWAINATYGSNGGTPKLHSLTVSGPEGELTVTSTQDGIDFVLKLPEYLNRRRPKAAPKAGPVTVKFSTALASNKTYRFTETYRYYIDQVGSRALATEEERSNFERIVDALHQLTYGVAGQRPHVTALAPLRTRPRRTYDELNEEFKPEGDHVPLVLSRLLNKQRKAGRELDALLRYGRASGLFEKIDVKRLGKQPSDPFQVRVKTKGPDANLIDVGYGVSQSLPIVIDSITAPDREVLLVQQPEVHLHPKAQAALGTFFAELAATTSKHFVIETHSDYLIDRIRIAVAEQIIAPEKVHLIYLERNGLDINIHELNLDSSGNIINAPASYREFFFEEELRLMNRAA